MMQRSDEIVIIDGPIVGLFSSTYRSGIIYSISLDNGAVITSPESFEAISASKIQRQLPIQRVPEHLTPAPV